MIKKLNILSKEYTINYKDDIIDVHRGNELAVGINDILRREINLYKTNSNDMLETLLHEVLHAIVHALNMHEILEEVEEQIVSQLSVVLADTFIRNKLLDPKKLFKEGRCAK